jgi:hypothetical protein
MTVDISKVFKANVKAIRTSLNDSNEVRSDALNEQLLGKQIIANTNKNRKSESEARKIVSQVAKEARNIVIIFI